MSRKAFDIEGFGDKTVELLVENGFVNTPADIYKLTTLDLLMLEGFGQLSAEKLFDSIQSKKNISLDKFIYALGIPNVGESTSKSLAQNLGSIENIIDCPPACLQVIDDIGIEAAREIKSFLSDEHNLAAIAEVNSFVNISDKGEISQTFARSLLIDQRWKILDFFQIPKLGRISIEAIDEYTEKVSSILNLKYDDFLIISPYNTQVKFIISKLEECKIKTPRVGTID